MNSSDAAAPIKPLRGKPLQDKTALVTGGSRNLGAVVAETLAGQGAAVAIGYLNAEDEAKQVVEAIQAHDVAGFAIQGDLADAAQVVGVSEQARDLLGGRVDVLINNAGPFAGGPLAALAEDEWDRIMNVNLKAAYLAAQVLVPGMREGGWGRIVNVSAGSAYVLSDSVYGLAKAALITLTEELALELGPEITVNAVAPGQIAESAPDIGEIDPTYVERAIARSPGGRLVTRSEVAQLVAWLCHPAADMITGHTIPIDAGWRFNRF